MVAGDDISLIIHAEAAVRIAVICKSDIEPLFHHKLLQMFDMGTSAFRIDVITVRFIIDHVSLCTQCVKYSFRDGPGGAICHIETDFHILEAESGHGNEVADITVPTRHIVHRAADVFTLSQRNIHFTVYVRLNLKKRLFIHFLAVVVDDLDAVVIIRIMGSRNHNAAVEIIYTRNVGYRRRRCDMHDIGIRPGSHEARAERIFKHVAGPARILADDDFGFPAETFTVIPAEEPSYFDRVLIVQSFVCLAAKSVRTKIFTHYSRSPLSISRKYL